LNNATANYEVLRQDLIIGNADIKDLPSIKDREAKADSLLKDNLSRIREYKNEVTDLQNLLKVINLKIRNLNRVNNDIKLQMRIMESQLKMGSSIGDDAAARSLIQEMRKSKIGKDSFEEIETSQELQGATDIENETDVNNLLDSSTEELTNPEPVVSTEVLESRSAADSTDSSPEPLNSNEVAADVKPEEKNAPEVQEESVEESQELERTEDGVLKTPDDDGVTPTDDLLREVDQSISQTSPGIDIDKVIEGDKKEEPKQPAVEQKNEEPKSEIDVDALLNTL